MVTDQLLEKFKRVRGKEWQPFIYQWFVTETIYREMYDEITPTFRSDHAGDFRYGPNLTVFQTDAGAMMVSKNNEKIAERDFDGEVVGRACDGDAVLVRRQ